MSYEKNRIALFEEQIDEYGYTFCQNCEKQSRLLDCHHVIFRSEAPNHKMLHSKENLILVCRSCHNWFHSKKSNRDKLMKQRNLKEKFYGEKEV